ncbi:makorin, ring finger protein, 4 [Chanos chanos]|uniref:RING-type E3 ubiquitin transferase n=1 Tax=Chanos chanos TaxID=29144 RepID=A0A6J2WAZ5_CHACN|nr:probable E3 ubiquitin-protein ligase makorin-1 [Chanos chanos]
MDRYGIPYRTSNKRLFSADRGICRQFISGACRYGPSCHYLHQWPSAPSTQLCRYFQKGACWFGERCRYLHIPPMDGGASGSRRASDPAVHHSALGGQVLPDRRGSEPSLIQFQGAYGFGRRASEPLVMSVANLQQNFERLTTGIVEEEEPDMAEGPSIIQHQGHLLHRQHNLIGAHQTATQNSIMANAALVSSTQLTQERTVTEMDKQDTSQQDGADQSGAAAPADRGRSAAYNLSKDVLCGICMDKVYEKSRAQERRFGILPNCSHAFCLGCIVTWRKTKDFQEDVIKACPQCRVKSAFYIPSDYWVSEGEPKEALIASFKEKSSKRRCSFFIRNGCCPFRSECIYSHDLPPGYRPRSRRAGPRSSTMMLEDLDSFQLLNYVIALTLLDDDDFLDSSDMSDEDFLDSIPGVSASF